MKKHLLFFAIAGAALVHGPSAKAANITGRASVIDGDTIDIGGQRIRLHGIDAPESGQVCNGASGAGYRCGKDAAFALALSSRPHGLRVA